MSELFYGMGYMLLIWGILYLSYKVSFPYIRYYNYRADVKFARYKKQVEKEQLNVEECDWITFFTKKEKRNHKLNDFEKDKIEVEGEKTE